MTNRIAGLKPRRHANNGHATPTPITPVSTAPVAAPPPSGPVSDGASPPSTVAAPPQTTPAGGRRADGTFAAGNAYARGNPFNRRLAAMRTAVLDAVGPGDVQDVIRAMLAAAKAGDVAAASVFLSYSVGKPKAAADPDQCDLDEFKLLASSPTIAEVARAEADSLPPDAAADLLRINRILRSRRPGARKAARKANAQADAQAIAEAMSCEDVAAALAVQHLLEDAADNAEIAGPGDPLNLQVGELRKTRCKRGGK